MDVQEVLNEHLNNLHFQECSEGITADDATYDLGLDNDEENIEDNDEENIEDINEEGDSE